MGPIEVASIADPEATATLPSGCIVREATAKDIPAINRLFAEVFGHARDDAATNWCLFENPAGPAIALIAELDGRVIAHRTLWPIPVRLHGESVRAAQSIDLMVHTAFRGTGLFRTIALESFRAARRHGIELLYGFPNQHALQAGRGLGWNHIGDVGSFSRPLRSDAFARLPGPLRPLATLALSVWPRGSIRRFDIRSERPTAQEIQALLSHRTASSATVCETDRSIDWYDWRFAPQTNGTYEWISARSAGSAVAFALWGRSPCGNRARLAEIVGSSDAAISAVISAIVARAGEAGCASLDAITNRANVLHALSGNGFRYSGMTAFRVRSLTDRRLPPFEDFHDWRLLGSDFDVY